MMGFYIVEEFLNNYTKINEYLRKDPNISSNFFQIIDSIQDFQFIRNETFTFLCELGPPEYAMTGADGYELSDRWEESLVMKKQVRALWESVLKS